MKALIAKAKMSASPIFREIADGDTIDMASRLTLVLLLLHSGYFWYLQIPMTFICAAAILFRSLYRSPTFWLLVSATLAWANFYNWFSVDNHKYLMLYWTIALHCSVAAPDPEQTLRANARWLIAGCMLFATFWKTISPDYLNGAFFHYSLLLDGRFNEIVSLISPLTDETFHRNNLTASELIFSKEPLDAVNLESHSNVSLLAQFLTWLGIGLEGLIALLFLAPNSSRLARAREGALLAFVTTTYAIATVIGFGWLLTIMGLAYCPAQKRVMRSLFVVAFFLIQIYLLPKSWLLAPFY